MEINVNSIYQAKLNEIQTKINTKTSNFSKYLETANSTKTADSGETTQSTNSLSEIDNKTLLTLLSANSMYNTSSLFSDGTENTGSELANLNALLALRQSHTK